uniref:COP9 signalosome subunit 7B n=1 Tax=Ursus maritimus TaxID=29073 RepID=A0A452UKX5_URSMA
MAGEQKPSSNLLEQFILLAKGTSGSALTALISQVLEAPGVYVFGELLELANVQELAEGANAAYLQLLNLFAYGTYPDYLANKESLPELSTAQQNKLKHLTIVSLASRMKCIPYSVLLKDLEMRNLRELEDLIIEAVYTDIIQGKLDQRNQLLEVDFCIGRDIRKKDINNIVKTLHEWCDGCEAVLLGIEQQVLRANQYKENHSRTQQQVEAEVTNIKKTLKATASSSAQEMEQQLAERECPPHAEQRQPTKKMSKVKGTCKIVPVSLIKTSEHLSEVPPASSVPGASSEGVFMEGLHDSSQDYPGLNPNSNFHQPSEIAFMPWFSNL